MKYIYFSLVLLSLARYGTGQNLVPNSGFEEYFTCPQTFNSKSSIKKIAPHWNSPSNGTPDLYNRCSRGEMGTHNITGVTEPYKGNGFAGFILWEEDVGFREYLQVRLIQPLQKGETYIVSFWYKMSTYSQFSIDRIGFSLHDTNTLFKYTHNIPDVTYEKIKDKAFDPNSGSWELLQTEYIAKGGERYLTIGNFSDNKSTKSFSLANINKLEPLLKTSAYYYLDEVNISLKNLTTQEKGTEKLSLDKKIIISPGNYTLEGIQFDYDSDILLPSSYEELDLVFYTLEKHPDWQLIINGYTDSNGSMQYNLELSSKRALAVKNYLTSKGITPQRIQCYGHGKTKPLAFGNDEESQKKNRRVEFLFIKNKMYKSQD
ncbi:MAG: OmpA family protein [Sporocytophaga sp.]|uniref:OmpA family protein n=1 Tax=Sporocytophaga sp. TaxID=2231183 RepID=UPI001B1868EE|nr:OmpA family protein [Sporocytophaga sp.]MBO9703150.1 OmpA family protein [Sporocytophaga sp.]